jgi:glycopeptide antibiotics resistance protein
MRFKLKWLFIGCLIVYLVIIARLIVFKYPFAIIGYSWSFEGLLRNIQFANFIPFRTIISSLFRPQLPVVVTTLFYNILAFIPLGVLLPLISEKARNWRVVLLVAILVSLTFEVVQLAALIGSGDVDDVILNATGALLGYSLFTAVWKHLWDRS